MSKKRKIWWIAGVAFVLLTVVALLVSLPPGGFPVELSALLKEEGFKQVPGYEREIDAFGDIIAEYELKPMVGKESEMLMRRIAEQFGAVNEHLGYRGQHAQIADRFTVEEDGTTYNVLLFHQGVPSDWREGALPESYRVIVQTDRFRRPTMLDWFKGLWPW